MATFTVCPRPELVTEAEMTTSVVGCAVSGLAIPNTGNAVGVDSNGNLMCPYQPTTLWGQCSNE